MYQALSESRILIVDDFSQFRLTLKSMLFKLGATQVDQAPDAVKAMKLCLENDYDIIFCDYNMGEGQDGQQFLEELHHRDILLKGVLFIMVTAETSSAQVMGAIEYRPDAYLTKPFTNDQLGKRLQRLMARNQKLKPIHQAINARDDSSALQLCDAIMQQTPTLRFSCLRLKSEILERQNNLDELLLLFQQVIKEQSLLWAEIGIGKILYAREDYEAALQHFQNMLNDFSRQVSIFDWIARCQQSLDQHQEAENTLLEAIRISPKSVKRQSTLGAVAESLEHHEVAQKAFRKTIDEGHHSCLLESQHYQRFFDNTLQVVSTLSGREQGKLVATTESVVKRMERKLQNDPAAIASTLIPLAGIFKASDRASQADDSLRRLSRILQDPNCTLDEQSFAQIQNDLGKMSEHSPDNKQLAQLADDMQGMKGKVAKKEEKESSARDINRQGMQLARQNHSVAAVEKFREAIQVAPHNPDYKLNAIQTLLTNKAFSTNPASLKEARKYLESISIEHTGTRWRLYKKLKGLLSDE